MNVRQSILAQKWQDTLDQETHGYDDAYILWDVQKQEEVVRYVLLKIYLRYVSNRSCSKNLIDNLLALTLSPSSTKFAIQVPDAFK